MELPVESRPRVRYEFEVEKVIGISNDGCYQVQWAPAWVSKFHLIGCEHLIKEFHMQQSEREIKSEPDPEESVQLDVPSPPVTSEDIMERKCEMIIGELREQFSSDQTRGSPQELAEDLETNTSTTSGPFPSTNGDNAAGMSNTSVSADGMGEYCSTQSSQNPPTLLSTVELVQQHQKCSDTDNDEKFPVETSFMSPYSSSKRHIEDDSCSCNYKCRLRKRPDESAYSCTHCNLMLNDKTSLKDRLRKRPEKEVSSPSHYNSVLTSKTHLKDGLRGHQGKGAYFHPGCNSGLRGRTSFRGRPRKLLHKKVNHCKNMFHEKNNVNGLGHHHAGQHKYSCSSCSYGTSEKANMVKHQRTHTGEKPYICKECGKAFAQKVNLTRHLLTHSSEKRFRCNICSESFTQEVHLKRHLINHSAKKIFMCGTCGKQFSRNDHLTEHLYVHSNEKPFKCSTCEKFFKQRSYLTRHQRIHTGVKPYGCEACGKSFNELSNRNQHLRHCASVV